MYTETGTGKLIIKAKVEYSLSGNQFTKESNPIQTTLLFPKVKQSGKSSISLVNRTEIIGVKTTASQGTILLLSNPSGNYNLISWIDPLDQKLYPLFQEK